MQGAEHDAAFVVAGAKGAILQSFRDAVGKAIADGETLADFRKRFDQIVETTGWKYRGDRDWRSKVIWETNLRTSHAAGRYQQMQVVKGTRPYWQWRHGGSRDPRPQHLALDGKVFAADDPFWQEFGTPPVGYGCRCSLFTLSDRDLERRGLTVEKGPALGGRLPIPDLPGQTTAMNPPEGWGHAHGSSSTEDRARLLEAVTRRLDERLAEQVRAEALAYQPNRRELLVERLRESGARFTDGQVVWVEEVGDRVAWLEQGDDKKGLQHIATGKRAENFEARGIPRDQLSAFLREALVNGRLLGPQGQRADRMIYEVRFNDQVHYVAITVGSNGFVVGANPAKAKDVRRLLDGQ